MKFLRLNRKIVVGHGGEGKIGDTVNPVCSISIFHVIIQMLALHCKYVQWNYSEDTCKSILR